MKLTLRWITTSDEVAELEARLLRLREKLAQAEADNAKLRHDLAVVRSFVMARPHIMPDDDEPEVQP